jgi:hypothetical protein
MDELAEELVLAQFAETDVRPLVATSGLHPIGGSGLLSEDGDTIVKLGKKWYINDRLAVRPSGELLAARLHLNIPPSTQRNTVECLRFRRPEAGGHISPAVQGELTTNIQ